MTVQLMLTCLCDALYGEVGVATVRVLEHCGVKVVFPVEQTCCGQPAFNSGDWDAARTVSDRVWSIFDPSIPIVIPSGSCAAMMRHGRGLMNEGRRGVAEGSVYELSEYLLDVIGVERWPLKRGLSRKRRVALHQSCHGRMIGLGDRQRRLLAMVDGIELVDFDQPEQCCGFGGAFAAHHATVSAGIGLEKLRCLREAGADVVASGDMGCLMSLKTLAAKEGLEFRAVHYAELLAEAIS